MAVTWFTVIFLLACLSSSEAKKKHLSCTKLNITLCKGLGYKRTTFPNPITQIQNQDETEKLTKFYPHSQLLQLNCTRVDPVPFLCSVYAPKCYPKMNKNIIPPCREFCQQAAGNCPKLVIKYRLPWPEPLNCSRYPKAGGDTKCINDSKFTIIKGTRRKKIKTKGKKNDTCCRQGFKAARKRYQCSLTSSTLTSEEGAFVKRVLRHCQTKEASFKACCSKEAERIKKKEERKRRKEERQKKKQKRKRNRQDKKLKKANKKSGRKSRRGNKKTRKDSWQKRING